MNNQRKLAGHQAIRDRLAMVREDMQYTVEHVLGDLGSIGQVKEREILSELNDQLDDVEKLIGDTGDE